MEGESSKKYLHEAEKLTFSPEINLEAFTKQALYSRLFTYKELCDILKKEKNDVLQALPSSGFFLTLLTSRSPKRVEKNQRRAYK